MARARRRTAWRAVSPVVLGQLWAEAEKLHLAKRTLPSSRALTDVPELTGFVGEYVFAQEIEQARPPTEVYSGGGDHGYDFVWGGQRVDVKAGRVVRGRDPDLLLFTDGMVRCDCYALVAVDLPICAAENRAARIGQGAYAVTARLTMICRAAWAHDRKPVQLSTGCRLRVSAQAARFAHAHNALVYREAV